MRKVGLALLLCACASERDDVEAMCQAAARVSTEHPAETATLLAQQLKDSAKSAEGRALLQRIFAAEPAQKAALMAAAAKKHGLPSCPLVAVWSPAIVSGTAGDGQER